MVINSLLGDHKLTFSTADQHSIPQNQAQSFQIRNQLSRLWTELVPYWIKLKAEYLVKITSEGIFHCYFITVNLVREWISWKVQFRHSVLTSMTYACMSMSREKGILLLPHTFEKIPWAKFMFISDTSSY